MILFLSYQTQIATLSISQYSLSIPSPLVLFHLFFTYSPALSCFFPLCLYYSLCCCLHWVSPSLSAPCTSHTLHISLSHLYFCLTDTGSDSLQTDEDQHSTIRQPKVRGPHQGSHQENGMLMPGTPELTPIFIIKNVVLKQVREVFKKNFHLLEWRFIFVWVCLLVKIIGLALSENEKYWGLTISH